MAGSPGRCQLFSAAVRGPNTPPASAESGVGPPGSGAGAGRVRWQRPPETPGAGHPRWRTAEFLSCGHLVAPGSGGLGWDSRCRAGCGARAAAGPALRRRLALVRPGVLQSVAEVAAEAHPGPAGWRHVPPAHDVSVGFRSAHWNFSW